MGTTPRIMLCVTAFALALTTASGGWAQAPSKSAGNAVALYEAGLKAMLAKDFAQACPTLARSYQLDPLPGALFTLAACYERWGKTHTAVQRYKAFIVLAEGLPPDKLDKQKKRLDATAVKLTELEPLVPTLTLVLEPPTPRVQVTLDGQPATLGTAIQVDPGEHRIVVKGPDGQTAEQVEQVNAGNTRRVALTVPKAAPAEPRDADPPATNDDEGGIPLQTWAFVAGGVGAAGIIVGAVTGGMVLANKSEVEDNCVELVCSPEGKEAADDAATLAMVSNIAFGVGAAGLVVGTLLLLLAPDEDDRTDVGGLRLSVGTDGLGASLTLSGGW